MQLSADQVKSFRDNGFLAVDQIASHDEVTKLRDLYDEIVADPTGLTLTYRGPGEDGEEGVITQDLAPDLKRPELLDTEYMTNAKRFAADLLGVGADEVTYGGLMFIYKPPGDGRDTPWHQDEAYWGDRNALKCNSLSVWMPLDDVTVESGCMQYMPGTHKGDVLDHVKPDGPTPLHLADPYDVSAAVPCEIPAGGATVHHCRTVHYGGSNVSTVPRRAMTTIFHGPATEREVPLEKAWLEGGRVWEDAR